MRLISACLLLIAAITSETKAEAPISAAVPITSAAPIASAADQRRGIGARRESGRSRLAGRSGNPLMAGACRGFGIVDRADEHP